LQELNFTSPLIYCNVHPPSITSSKTMRDSRLINIEHRHNHGESKTKFNKTTKKQKKQQMKHNGSLNASWRLIVLYFGIFCQSKISQLFIHYVAFSSRPLFEACSRQKITNTFSSYSPTKFTWKTSQHKPCVPSHLYLHPLLDVLSFKWCICLHLSLDVFFFSFKQLHVHLY